MASLIKKQSSVDFLREYKSFFPNAQNPLNFLYAFGIDGLREIIKKNEGNEIQFIPSLKNKDKVNYRILK